MKYFLLPLVMCGLILTACEDAESRIHKGDVVVIEKDVKTDQGTELRCSYHLLDADDTDGAELPVGVSCEWPTSTVVTTTTPSSTYTTTTWG